MGLDANIFGKMLARPRTADEYQNEYAAQDDAKLMRQANLLALQDKRQAAADAALQRQQAQDVRNKLTGLPATATPEDVARVYQGAGMVDHAEKVLKSWTARQKELAGIDKTKGETLDGALTRHRTMLEQAQTPQDAARLLAAQYSDQILGPVMAKTHGPLEAAVQAIPQTPAEFAQWRGANTMGMTKYQEHVAQKPTAVDLGDRKVMIDMNPNSPTYLKQVAENKVNMSPAEASAAANRPLIAGANGYTTNQPYVDAQKQIAQAGASVTYGSPVQVDIPGVGPALVQPGNRGGPAQIVKLPTGEPVKPAPKDKTPPVEFTKSVAGLKELANGIDSYEKALKENNGASPLAMGARRANLQGAYTSLQMGLKNAFELGALAGPDLALLQGMLADPTSVQAGALGDKGLAAQLSQARQYLKNRGKAVYDAHKQPVPPEYEGAGGSAKAAAAGADIPDDIQALLKKHGGK